MEDWDISDGYHRRDLLSASALAAAVSMAGCGLFSDDGNEDSAGGDSGGSENDGSDGGGGSGSGGGADETGLSLEVTPPVDVEYGATHELSVSVTNNEDETRSLTVEMKVGDEVLSSSDGFDVEPSETAELTLSFVLPDVPPSTEIAVELLDEEQSVETYTTRVETLRAAPEADIVVAKDGSGDYERFSEASRVAEPGDVVRLKEGEYTGTADLRITLVGAGPEETTFVPTASPQGGALPAEYRDLRLELESSDELEFGPAYDRLVFHNTVVDPKLVTSGASIRCIAEQSEFSRELELGHIRDSGSRFTDHVRITQNVSGTYWFYNSSTQSITFSSENDIPETIRIDITGSATGSLTLGEETESQERVQIVDSELDAITQGSGNSLEIIDSSCDSIDSGADSLVVEESTVTGSIQWLPDEEGRARVTNSQIQAHDFGVSAIEGNGILELYGCLIRGQVHNSPSRVGGTISRCTFRTFEEFSYFIDGSPARTITKNAFEGADIRIDSGDTRVYDEQDGLGNYYSEWDGGEDTNGDGVSDRPRLIPGDGEVTDKYPLMDDDLSVYLS